MAAAAAGWLTKGWGSVIFADDSLEGAAAMDSGAIDWTVIGVGIALAGLMLATTRGIRSEMRGIRADMRALSDRLDKRIDDLSARQDDKMDAVSERLGRLEQEQARMNGMLETIRAGLSYRVERADAGDRVAEDAESYEPEE